MKTFRKFTEERIREIIISFGRFNPPTIGHQENIESIAAMAKGKTFKIYASQSEDPKKNPLGYEEKIKFMRKMFPAYGRNIILDRNVKNIFDVASTAYDEGYTRFTVAVGSDRVKEFKALLQKYDGAKGAHGYYKFPDGINVVSTGTRDPDIDDRTGEATFAISASKMRSAAAENDLKTFSAGVPKTFGGVKELFNAVRKGMGLEESYNFRTHVQFDTISEVREHYINGSIFNVGDVVSSNKTAEDKLCILERGANHVLCKNLNTLKENKFFIKDLINIQ
jgi:hypothetical protein